VLLALVALGVSAYSPDQLAALRAIDYYRELAHLQPASLNEKLCDAADRHARYRLANWQAEESPHSESRGLTHFTGKNPTDRMKAAGYAGPAMGECISFGNSTAQESIAGLIAVPYHRLPFLMGSRLEVGVGSARKSGVPMSPIWVYNVGGTFAPYSFWPPAGATRVPPKGDVYESPSPMRMHPSKSEKVGYVISMTTSDWSYSFVSAKLTEKNGKAVEAFFNHEGNDEMCRNSVLIIPRSPLKPNQAYTAQVKIRSAGNMVVKSWNFRTGSDTDNFDLRRPR
jgi:hypothetical protein